MYNIRSQAGVEQAYVTEFIADSRGDIATLPINYQPGSTCLVIEDSSIWMLNGHKEWKEI